MEKLLDAIVATIKGVQTRADQRVAALEARVAKLERKPHTKFAGQWAAERSYESGVAVTHKGLLWIRSSSPDAGEPGADFLAWRLAHPHDDELR